MRAGACRCDASAATAVPAESGCAKGEVGECSGRGVCEVAPTAANATHPERVCFCAPGWGGHDCSHKKCTGCSAHGYCLNGTCVCADGFGGADCATPLATDEPAEPPCECSNKCTRTCLQQCSSLVGAKAADAAAVKAHACYLNCTDGCLQGCFDATVEDGTGGGSCGVHSAMREGATFAAAAGAAALQPLAAW